MKKLCRYFIVPALFLLLIFCFSACGDNDTITLNVYNWGEYISDGGEGSLDVNKAFEEYYEKWYYEKYGKEIKVNVNYTTYASNEDLYAKMKSGAADYDIIVPSDYMIERLKSEGLLQTIDLEKIPNYSNILDKFKNPYYDNGEEKYSVM